MKRTLIMSLAIISICSFVACTNENNKSEGNVEQVVENNSVMVDEGITEEEKEEEERKLKEKEHEKEVLQQSEKENMRLVDEVRRRSLNEVIAEAELKAKRRKKMDEIKKTRKMKMTFLQ